MANCPKCKSRLLRDGNCPHCIIQPAAKYRFTATLNRKHGARVFKGTANGCRDMSDAIYVVRAILNKHSACEPDVTSIKITISPTRK